MSVYAIVLQKPDTAVWQTIRETWPDYHYIWHTHAAFVAPPGITTATQISTTLGFNADSYKIGIAIEMTPSHLGFVEEGLVAWLGKAFRERS